MNLSESSTNTEFPRHIPPVIPITERTLEKAHTLCQIVREEGKAPHEWFSFLLAKKSDPSYLVRDLLVVKGTKANRGEVEVEGQHHALAAEEVRQINATRGTDYYIIGWLHSHADFAPCHSLRDHNNFEQLLNTIGFNTEQSYFTPFEIIESAPHYRREGNTLMIQGEELEDGIITYTLDMAAFQELLEKNKDKSSINKDQSSIQQLIKNPEEFLDYLVHSLQMRTQQPLVVGFGYSIVVNDHAVSPYAEIGTIEEKVITAPGKRLIRHYQTQIEPQKVADDLSFTKQQLYEMVHERIVFPPAKKKIRKPYWGPLLRERKFKKSPSSEASSHSSPAFSLDETLPVRKKLTLQNLNLSALTGAFLHQVLSYQSLHQFEVTPYSQYLDAVMGYLSQGRNLGQAIAHAGLPQAQETQSSAPKFTSHSLVGMIQRNLLRRMSQSPTASLEVAFMYHFIFSDKNEAIVEWAPKIYEGNR